MKRRGICTALLWGGLAGFVWTAGLCISFVVWQYAACIGAALLAAAAGTADCVLLSREGWHGFGAGLLAAVLTAVILTPAIWSTPWVNQMFLALYRGYHVTEAGFSGIFDLLHYTGVSVLCILLF